MMTCPFEFANKFANDDVEEEMDSKNDCERLRSLTLEEPNACIERRERVSIEWNSFHFLRSPKVRSWVLGFIYIYIYLFFPFRKDGGDIVQQQPLSPLAGTEWAACSG